MNRLRRWVLLWFLLGEQYFVIEAVYRFFRGERVHVAMLAVGGLAAVLIGAVNQIPRFYRAPVIIQALAGTVITLGVEFCTGYLLNIRLGLSIWDYTGLTGNFMGQVCLPFAVVWFFLIPLAIWLEDRFRWLLWREGTPYNLAAIYRDFLLFWRKPLVIWGCNH